MITTSGTPTAITPTIKAFCAQIAPDSLPFFIEMTPAPDAQPQNCFVDVQALVDARGGAMCVGWAIWEWPFVFLEAEFHATWRDPVGKLHDITPRPAGISRVLFLPDPHRSYEGRQVEPVRQALTESEYVSTFMDVLALEYKFLNRGARAEQHGELNLTGPEAREWVTLQQAKAIASRNAAVFGHLERTRLEAGRPENPRRERNARKRQRKDAR